MQHKAYNAFGDPEPSDGGGYVIRVGLLKGVLYFKVIPKLDFIKKKKKEKTIWVN